jgi:hypothetical protein
MCIVVGSVREQFGAGGLRRQRRGSGRKLDELGLLWQLGELGGLQRFGTRRTVRRQRIVVELGDGLR